MSIIFIPYRTILFYRISVKKYVLKEAIFLLIKKKFYEKKQGRKRT